MIYFTVFIILFVSELLYFRIANYYNIIDKPNERSSHNSITLRGGGIVFYFAVLSYFIWSDFQYPWFFLGLTLMTIISFIDDIISLSNKLRLIVHFCAVLLMAYELQIFDLPWYYLLGFFFIIIGVINAYNFMDGINGITAGYSLVVSILLIIVNYNINFIANDLLIFTILGLIVFAFFNFRSKAKCFAGDVGSVAIAFILLFSLCSLILHTGNYIYILFLTVYGLDAVWTILQRLVRGENVFKAHRSHLYQYLVNEKGSNKLMVSLSYSVIQFMIGIVTVYFSHESIKVQLAYSLSTVIFGSFIYLLIKSTIYRKYVLKTTSSSL
ncbi:MraY family glycosyltransferase [Sphingobacterium bovistauri]|uniref:UDP-GlcNAc--UDP-phosphate GlcNAc-1-phosphate transferase n=1 Tax=Sphingobacterium bovistauri TaxID=2781959 RepID=A0ABS7Z1P8_9SPHI|nr:UDP-GlcNAc--UDP-phosphate GlcNAc-1-phosphate transferase [Sphingobacterium bovistauri]MCA5004101.1 UDP-GlcNAc--UDP-phosphate GlcNAc-1-phosphate transferase [Sphingobacterium bovistauri]